MEFQKSLKEKHQSCSREKKTKLNCSVRKVYCHLPVSYKSSMVLSPESAVAVNGDLN